MLFNEFVLHNFGIYRGRHVIDLNPEHKRPVILFGALNGSGKTTFLDGLQLALYGKQARCAGRGNMGYPEFLRSAINRYIPPSEGAALELEFCHHTEGRWQTIRVCRSWVARGASVKEKLEVHRDGTVDTVLSEHWAEYVEDFIPSQISELFFFDGEKIEGLAEEKSASAIIRTGIHALLGLDVVDRLSSDLKVLQRRRKAELLDDAAKARIAVKYKELEEASEQQQSLTQLQAHQNEQVYQHESALADLRERYRLEGGELAEQAGEHEKALKLLLDEKGRHDARLIELAAGAAPLLLVRELLKSTRQQAEAEEEARKAQLMLQELEERDHQVIALLELSKGSSELVARVDSLLHRDRVKRGTQAAHPIYLNVPASTFAPFGDQNLNNLEAEIERELAQSRELKTRIEHVERTLAGMPSAEALAPLKQEMHSRNETLLHEKGKLLFIQEQLSEVQRRTERLEREYHSILEQEAHSLSQSETNQRGRRSYRQDGSNLEAIPSSHTIQESGAFGASDYGELPTHYPKEKHLCAYRDFAK
jgi:DNA sulfur modification protein DndD